MKKKNLKVLKLNRKTISNLETSSIIGGTEGAESRIICPHGDGEEDPISWVAVNCTLISFYC